jgi:hypothetical protein
MFPYQYKKQPCENPVKFISTGYMFDGGENLVKTAKLEK